MTNSTFTTEELDAYEGPIVDGTILEAFACGLYTLLFLQAIWHLHKKGNKGWYAFALVILWITVIICTIYYSAYAVNVLIVGNTSPLVLDNKLKICMTTPLVIADGILIWRCNIVWGRRYISAVLVMLLMSTVGFLIAAGLLISSGTQTEVHTMSLLASLLSLCSAFITVLATSLIALKIVLVTRTSRMQNSYAKIIEIIVESAALVSFTTLVMGILELISYVHPYDLGTESGLLVFRALAIAGRIQNPVIGIGPTLIAFRVAGQPAHTEISGLNGTIQLSNFTFQRSAHSSTNTNQHILHPRLRSRSLYEDEPVERM